MKIELRSTEEKRPIVVDSAERAMAIVQLVKSQYNKEVLISELPETFDIDQYNIELNNYKSFLADIIILGHDLASLEQTGDMSSLLNPIFVANEKLVEQYKAGNEKALNALLGKFLKDNKGYDPKDVKEEIIKLLGEFK